ncbi:hypothetical protein ACIPVA_03995 [Streptomyces anulatus]
MKLFGREPALIIATVSAALSLLVSFQFGLDAEQAAAIVAVISAVFAAATAVITRPIAPSAFTGLVAAAVALLAAYGMNVSAETVGALNAAVLAILGLMTRGQVTPTPKPTTPAAG